MDKILSNLRVAGYSRKKKKKKEKRGVYSIFEKLTETIKNLTSNKEHRKDIPLIRTINNTRYEKNTQTNPAHSTKDWKTYYDTFRVTYVRRCCDAYINTSLASGYTIDTESIDTDNIRLKLYLNRLLQRPEGITSNTTWSDLLHLIWDSRLVLGDCFLEPAINETYELIQGFKYIHNNQLYYDNNTETYNLFSNPRIQYEPNDLIHIRDPSVKIEDSPWGVSVIDSCADSIALLLNATSYNNDVLKNNGINPNIIMKYDKDMSNASFNAEIERLGVANQEKKKGGVLAVKGADVIDVSNNNKDMSYIELMKFARDDVIRAFGTPPQLAGVIETASLGSGTGESQNKNWKDTYEGKTRGIEDAFNNCFHKYGFNEKFKFNPLDVKDRLLTAQIDQIYLQNGVKTIDEVRNDLGLDKIGTSNSWGAYYR